MLHKELQQQRNADVKEIVSSSLTGKSTSSGYLILSGKLKNIHKTNIVQTDWVIFLYLAGCMYTYIKTRIHTHIYDILLYS